MTEELKQRIEEKTWFSRDEHLEVKQEDVFVGEVLFKWYTDSYIPVQAVNRAQDDEDVMVGDIDDDEDHGFHVNLYVLDESDQTESSSGEDE